MKRLVLDASAVMAFFEDRAGAEKVEELIGLAVSGKRELLMSVVNWGEVYYATWHERGRDAARRTLAEIAQLPIEIVDADFALTKLAAEFRAQHKLPYADCFAAALAKDRKAPLITTDKDFSEVERQVHILWASEFRRR
ncbi:MAG TPA: type II toxin-antitoxin system VapC family toxin [Candidatus Acidoferrales bacterium]|nr:type II toxin-antitoxin system VapC family toxin [Candidatus Acidoferrales bacterium]